MKKRIGSAVVLVSLAVLLAAMLGGCSLLVNPSPIVGTWTVTGTPVFLINADYTFTSLIISQSGIYKNDDATITFLLAGASQTYSYALSNSNNTLTLTPLTPPIVGVVLDRQ